MILMNQKEMIHKGNKKKKKIIIFCDCSEKIERKNYTFKKNFNESGRATGFECIP